MTGKEFKNLDIDSKVKYVNNLLKQGDTVDNIRITLGVGKNYIGNTFTKHGYKLNRNINQYENINVATDTTNIIHRDIDSNDKAVARHYRIYNDVHKEFKAFCKSHKQYKVQDIISSAIKEYLDKYNK